MDQPQKRALDQLGILLAGLATGRGATYNPVQVQKLFFLIDTHIGSQLGGPFFAFKPYNYGPFDKAVYEQLKVLARDGLVEITHNGRWQEYRLTDKGQECGNGILESEPEAANYIERASSWVRSLSFYDLIRAIYKAYPDMRANSVFQE